MINVLRFLQAKEIQALRDLERAEKVLAQTWDPDERALAKRQVKKARIRHNNASFRLEAALV